jgi:hypothetical protein
MWAVLYDDGMSLTTASERIARSLAEAERQRGRRVTVRRLDDVETHPRGAEEPVRPPGPEPISEPEPTHAPEPEPSESLEPIRTPEQPEPLPTSEPVSKGRPPQPAPAPEPAQVLGPTQAAEPPQAAEPASVPEPASQASPPEITREPQPARAATPARRRRLVLYALAAASIVVAAALADHWDALPRVGATTSSSPAQVSGPPRHAQLLPPLDQPPVMHFSSAVRARSAGGGRSGGGRSATARGG